MVNGLDYAGGVPGGAAIAAAGYRFVCRYLSSGGLALPGKLLTPAEADDLRANGIDIVSNWETAAEEMLGGYDAGCSAAAAALNQALACGGFEDRPIYFSADFDAAPEQQISINAYLQGAATVLGTGYVGIYGGYWPVSRALDAGVATWAWQTQAWSGGNQDPRINILQHNDVGFVTINGVECDVDESLTADFGQWSLGGDMKLTDTLTDAYGNQVSVGDILKWISYHGDLTIDQLGGTGTRDSIPATLTGWPQLNGRTIVDALAEIGAHLGIPGYQLPVHEAVERRGA
jgi:hypothetical protein